MIQSHIDSITSYGMVLKFEKFFHLSDRFFGLDSLISLGTYQKHDIILHPNSTSFNFQKNWSFNMVSDFDLAKGSEFDLPLCDLNI